MADKQNTTERIIRNGCEPVTRQDIEGTTDIMYEQTEALTALFRAIERLTLDNNIKKLSKHGRLQVNIQADYIDEMHERARKAGVIGELVDEVDGDH
jgi:hypothetical protein